jgi:molybdopterin-guanine dinucleotide biosynthesis protein A
VPAQNYRDVVWARDQPRRIVEGDRLDKAAWRLGLLETKAPPVYMSNVDRVNDPLPLYILAGGRSSRFGADKARALVGGKPLLLQVVGALAPRVTGCTVVADAEGKYADLGLRTIAEPAPGLGPLAGLQAALLDRDAPDWLLLVSCDWVGLNPAWVDLLLGGRRPSSSAVAFRGQVWEPLLSLYRRSLRGEVAQRLRDGRLALWRLLEEVRAECLPLPRDWAIARQVNRPSDLASPGRGR